MTGTLLLVLKGIWIPSDGYGCARHFLKQTTNFQSLCILPAETRVSVLLTSISQSATMGIWRHMQM